MIEFVINRVSTKKVTELLFQPNKYNNFIYLSQESISFPNYGLKQDKLGFLALCDGQTWRATDIETVEKATIIIPKKTWQFTDLKEKHHDCLCIEGK